jgi:hypothetical protein
MRQVISGMLAAPRSYQLVSVDLTLIGLFRINSPTITLSFEDGRHVSHTLPVGSIVKSVDGRIGEKGLLEVVWEGKPALMFAVDLKSRGTKLR